MKLISLKICFHPEQITIENVMMRKNRSTEVMKFNSQNVSMIRKVFEREKKNSPSLVKLCH